MITSAKLDVYSQFKGDVDMWQRRGMPGSDAISGADWAAIDVILAEPLPYKRGVVSDRYAKWVHARLVEVASDSDVATRLLDMA
jgi:hypothetical protein